MEPDALLALKGNMLIAFDGSLAMTVFAGSLTGDVWNLWFCWPMKVKGNGERNGSEEMKLTDGTGKEREYDWDNLKGARV